jgi:hypothetical protein
MEAFLSNGKGGPLPSIPGRSLALRTRLTKKQRAVLAAEVLDGRAQVILSLRQLVSIFGVSHTLVHAACKLLPETRVAVLRGRAVSFATTNGNGHVRPLTDSELRHLAKIVGTERMLEAAAAVEH